MAFYDDIGMSEVIPSNISLRGSLRNMTVNSTRLFVPDGRIIGGYAFGTIFRLNDTTLIAAASRYKANGFDDFAYANIVAKKSTDNGTTWGSEEILQENIGIVNTIAPSFVRLDANHIMLFFATKSNNRQTFLYLKESLDNGVTWAEPRRIDIASEGYYPLVNDRVIVNNGRILLPVAFALDINADYDRQVSCCFYSDDKGKTWKRSNYLKSNFALMEPGVSSISKNELLMTIRTKEGFIYFARSINNGATWGSIYKTNIESPESPQTIARINNSDTLVMLWNNTPYTPGHNNRSRLTFAFSIDRGLTWHNPVNLQSDKSYSYFYPSIFVDRKDTIHITYGIRSNTSSMPSLYYDKFNLKDLAK